MTVDAHAILASYGTSSGEIISLLESKGVKALFLCITGSHMWGTATPGSDLDIRGIFAYDVHHMLSVREPKDTVEVKFGDIDIAAWELRKAMRLLDNCNGNAVEMLKAPTVFYKTASNWTRLADLYTTKELYNYYKGYYHGQRKRAGLNRGGKSIAYTYREIMAGIYLMRTGKIIFDFNELIAKFKEEFAREWPRLEYLMSNDGWRSVVQDANFDFDDDWIELEAMLDAEYAKTSLPSKPTNVVHLDVAILNAYLRPVLMHEYEEGFRDGRAYAER